MIVLADTNNLERVRTEIGYPVEQLLTPLTRFNRVERDGMFAIDNGAYTTFSAKNYLSLLDRERDAIGLCRWVAAPDVVGSAIRTLEAFKYWQPKLIAWPIALVAQNGQESLPIPWCKISALFIGGETEWKLGPGARSIIKAAQIMGVWCHVGRVNTPNRFSYFEELGVDSIDGSALGMAHKMGAEARALIANRHPRLPLDQVG